MNLNLTVLGQAIAFSLFVWFCMKYVWPPIIGGLQERQERIARGLAEAEKAEQEREKAEARAEEMIQDAKAKAAEIVAQAQKRGNEIVESSKDDARTESERIKQSAQSEIERNVVGARDGLRKQVGSLAVEGARRILGTEIDEKAHDKVIDDLIRQI